MLKLGEPLRTRAPSSFLDSEVHARALAALFGSGGGVTLASLLFPHWRGLNVAGLAAPAIVAVLVCGGLLLAGSRIPLAGFHVLLGLGTVCICVAVHFGGSSTHGVYATYFVWIALYAFHFFPRRAAFGHLGLVSAGYAGVLALSHSAAPGPSWLVLMGTATVTGLVVENLVAKVNGLACTDPMTGVANRRAWDEALEQEVGRASRHRRPLCVAVLDLDGLKTINDNSGHRAGDDMIIAATSSWQTMLRSQDYLARLGGDEFGLILPECPAEEARLVLMRMNAALTGLTASSGIACLRVGEQAFGVCARADAAMYEAKRSGRSRVVVAA